MIAPFVWIAQMLGFSVWRLVAYSLVVIFVLLSFAWFVAYEQNIGSNRIVTQINQQNKDTLDVADKIRTARQTLCVANPAADVCLRDAFTRDK